MPSPVQQALAIRNRGRRSPRVPRVSLNLSAPRRFERALQKVLLSVVQVIADDLRRRLIPQLHSMVSERAELETRNVSDRQDVSIARRVAELIAATQASTSGILTPEQIEREIIDAGVDMSSWNQEQVQRAFNIALGVQIFQDEPYLQEALESYTAETTALIKDVSTQFTNQTERTVLQGLRQGLRHEEIAKQVLGQKGSRFAVAKNRAKLIGRDQMNKLNGKLTELRQKNAGINEYIWRTVGDDRVRPSHRELKGKTFSWDEPPSVGHPGEDVNCRCYAEPVFDV